MGRQCQCGAVAYEHEHGEDPDCEYRDHHCDTCHARGNCTLDECVSERRLIESGALPDNDPRMRLRRGAASGSSGGEGGR